MDEGSTGKKVTKKKLKKLQNKWIESLSEDGKENEDVLETDFSEVDGRRKKKKGKLNLQTVGEEVLEGGGEDDVALDGVDLEMINEIVQRVVNIEVERAIRELKDEIREQSEITRKEITEQMRLEMETLRQEMELTRSSKRGKGLFERF